MKRQHHKVLKDSEVRGLLRLAASGTRVPRTEFDALGLPDDIASAASLIAQGLHEQAHRGIDARREAQGQVAAIAHELHRRLPADHPLALEPEGDDDDEDGSAARDEVLARQRAGIHGYVRRTRRSPRLIQWGE